MDMHYDPKPKVYSSDAHAAAIVAGAATGAVAAQKVAEKVERK